ncbi:unnamed protein product [Porites lobata]|uniref:Uncharacterized protein n=1 Tax=Porites lobata TaxID=104759 RepID=A0ABN8N8J0_9CNID|nr:unnamed protein product [Porites lobata]
MLSNQHISETLVEDEPTDDLFICDHAAVSTRLGMSRPGLFLKTTTYRKIKSINLDSYHSDIQASSLCNDKQFDTADD